VYKNKVAGYVLHKDQAIILETLTAGGMNESLKGKKNELKQRNSDSDFATQELVNSQWRKKRRNSGQDGKSNPRILHSVYRDLCAHT
jgi:hypothetical protein